MRAILLSFVLIGGLPAWATVKNIRYCESYLGAPDNLKQPTKDFLSRSTSASKRAATETELAEYAAQAPLDSQHVAGYLKGLHVDAPYYEKDFSAGLFTGYLLRDGNTKLAVQRLPDLLALFWTSLHFAEQGRIVGAPWMKPILEFLPRAVGSYPEPAHQAWSNAYRKYIPQIIDLYGFTRVFRQTYAYMKVWPRKGQTQFAEERARYVLQVIRELKYMRYDSDLNSLGEFYVLDDLPFQDNDTFLLDMKLCAGRDPQAISPLHAFIFLYRLAQELREPFPQAEFLEIDGLSTEIEQLHLQHPF